MASDMIEQTPARADRITMRIIGVLAAAMALALAAGQVTIAWGYAFTTTPHVSLVADLPISVVPGQGVIDATAVSVDLTTDALSSAARALFAGGALVLALTALAVGAAVASLLFAAASARPFRTLLYRWSLIAGILLVLGPLLATGLTGLASMMAADQLNAGVAGVVVPAAEVSGWGMAVPVIGLAVVALGLLFRRMETLQRDTEGLV